MSQFPIPTLRPSALPKLARCPRYQGEADAGKYAARGTELDKLYRAVLSGELKKLLVVTESDRGIQWAVETTQIIAAGEKIISAEPELTIEFLGMGGTADAAIPTLDTSFDLKSGEERDYEGQQAAYAGGMMDKYFTDEWHIYLLYCDLRKVEKTTWTRGNAEATVREVFARVNDPMATEKPCEYCDWCTHKFECRARLEGVAWWAGKDPRSIDWTKELSDPGRLSAFLKLCQIITKDKVGMSDHARRLALAMIEAGTPVDGYAKSFRKGDEYILPLDVGHYIQDLGFGPILEAYGRLSADKFAAVWAAKKGDQPLPAGIIQSSPGSTFVRALPEAKEPKAKAQKEAKIKKK